MPIPQNLGINPEADRRLNRIAFTYGLIVFVLLILTSLLIPLIDAESRKTLTGLSHSPKLVALNILSILVVLVPFYFGIHRLFQARLEIGRERVGARVWSEAVTALEPFNAPMQRFLDGSGEAHFLLAQAYTGLGDKAKAESARAFVRRKKSVWAEKLTPGRVQITAGKARTGRGAGVYAAPEQENRPRPSKGRPKRRF